MKPKVYEQKLNGVVRERLTVNGNMATLEMLAFDGKLMHTEWLVEGKDGRIQRFKPKRDGLRCSPEEEQILAFDHEREEQCQEMLREMARVASPERAVEQSARQILAERGIPWKDYDPRQPWEIERYQKDFGDD